VFFAQVWVLVVRRRIDANGVTEKENLQSGTQCSWRKNVKGKEEIIQFGRSHRGRIEGDGKRRKSLRVQMRGHRLGGCPVGRKKSRIKGSRLEARGTSIWYSRIGHNAWGGRVLLWETDNLMVIWPAKVHQTKGAL